MTDHGGGDDERAFFVGIGSSAGGLEALSALLPGLPAGLGLRFVVVQHLSPTHRSMMVQLLGRVSQMPVLEVVDGCVPVADTVYITPPNRNVVLDADGRLRLLEPPEETVPKPSANLFFSSLAEVIGDRALGIVLSGTGSDGALGLHDIKAAGGFAMAQDPSECKYNGMARAAIEAGGVDWILRCEQMGAEIARIVERQRRSDGCSHPLEEMPRATLQLLLQQLYAHTRIDFTGYKEATLLRRIERRMTSTGSLTLDQYMAYVDANPDELRTLSQDMLISVTSFFRDRSAFERLGQVLGQMLMSKPESEDLRVWVAGCASGEEAYSIAMLLHDMLSTEKGARRVQIFATDIDDAALSRARRGVYPPSLMGELDPRLLKAHFVRHADGFEATKTLRSMVMFARHNLVQDPPFARLDLVSCRNVLIYLQNPLQERVLNTFHYALNPGGLLFLGRSEGVHSALGHFDAVERSAHLYRRSATRSSSVPLVGSSSRARPARRPSVPVDHDELVTHALASRFLPAAVLVDDNGDVRHVKGDVSEFITLPDGRPGYQLMSLMRRELRAEMASLVRLARAQRPSAETPKPDANANAPGRAPMPALFGRWRSNRAISVDMVVRQSVQWLRDAGGSLLLLVCFEKRPREEASGTVGTEMDESGAMSGSALEEQLAATREHLYTVIEELETSNEESQSLNEEIQTANEELQSTNEELEAANEELQAANEELTTVNEELQVKNLEWQAVNAELSGIYSTVDFPLLAFDHRLTLTRVNRAVQRQIGMEDKWIGRHVSALPWPTGMPDLVEDLQQVQAEDRTKVRQLVNVGSRDWVLRMMPRVPTDGERAGVLVQMEDNTQLRRSQLAAMRSDAQMRQLADRSVMLICVSDPSGRLLMVNPMFERTHDLAPGSSAGKRVEDVLPAAAGRSFRDALLECIRQLDAIEREETIAHNGRTHELLATYFPLFDDDGAVSGVCYQALDITRRRQVEEELLAARSARLAAEGMARTKSSFLANMSHEIRTPMNAVLGLSRLALDGDLPPAERVHISNVHAAAQALTRMLDDVLDFSKLEAGEMRLESSVFDLPELLKTVRRLFDANAARKGVALSVDLPLGVPSLLIGDAVRLSQVLNNLVSNAVKFTHDGEVRISVAPMGAEEPGHERDARRCALRFSVRDTGIGIDDAMRESIFDAYCQGDETITRRFGGTGLGLAICSRLVTRMGGQLGVNSTLGKGSEFWFAVAFEEPPPAPALVGSDDDVPNDAVAEMAATGGEAGAADAQARDMAATAALSSTDGGVAPSDWNPARAADRLSREPAPDPTGRLLLVEDNPLNQIVLQALVEKLGYAAEVADNGADALATVSAQGTGRFTAVLMDLHMPVMDGLEATRSIRALPGGHKLPVIAVTAATLPAEREACLTAGMDGHVAKPLDINDVERALRQAIDRRAGATSSA